MLQQYGIDSLIDFGPKSNHITQRAHLLSSPESEKAKADKEYSSRLVLLRNSVFSQRVHVDLRFDKRSSSEMIYNITYGCPFGRVSSDFLKLDKVATSYQTGS